MLLKKHGLEFTRKSLFVIDQNRISCAGIAPLDLMYTLISEHYGENFARKVSDWFLHTDVRPSGGPQKSGILEGIMSEFETTVSCRSNGNHLSNVLSLREISIIVGISPRQINRLFSKYLNQSTMSFYKNLRLDLSQKLLSQSHLSVTEIALSSGFTSSSQFSQTFRGKLGLTPSKFKNM